MTIIGAVMANKARKAAEKVAEEEFKRQEQLLSKRFEEQRKINKEEDAAARDRFMMEQGQKSVDEISRMNAAESNLAKRTADERAYAEKTKSAERNQALEDAGYLQAGMEGFSPDPENPEFIRSLGRMLLSKEAGQKMAGTEADIEGRRIGNKAAQLKYDIESTSPIFIPVPQGRSLFNADRAKGNWQEHIVNEGEKGHYDPMTGNWISAVPESTTIRPFKIDLRGIKTAPPSAMEFDASVPSYEFGGQTVANPTMPQRVVSKSKLPTNYWEVLGEQGSEAPKESMDYATFGLPILARVLGSVLGSASTKGEGILSKERRIQEDRKNPFGRWPSWNPYK